MTEAHRAILISVKPRFANAIFANEKTVELRRVFPEFQGKAIRMAVYSSSPDQLILGTVICTGARRLAVSTICRRHASAAKVTRAECASYFEGIPSGMVLELSSPQLLAKPVPLSEILRANPRLRMPQSYRYLRADRVPDRVMLDLAYGAIGTRVPKFRAGATSKQISSSCVAMLP